ncbi:MAG: MFS transporter [Marinilabiliales bacterium]|mgnify:CR=1 FL=1|nr:MAG: MFS transporter [Marinilabiliales bacterium]
MDNHKGIVKNSKSVINAWSSYDIANSAYNLIISTVLYPIYYTETTVSAYGSEMVKFMGYSIKNTVLYEYGIALGYFVIILLTLTLSGMADVGGLRKRFMQIFTFIGAFACSGLYLFTGENLWLGAGLPALAVIGFAGSLVYYNSFLPLIATKDRHDKVSARGFSLGYAGSMILLIICLVIIESYESLGFNTKLDAVQTCFLIVGVWWLGIAQIAFRFLKEKRTKVRINSSILFMGFKEIRSVFVELKGSRSTSLFLIAFFFLSMGVQVIMIVAALFGSTELGIEGTKLIITIIIIQLLGIVGSILFSRVSMKLGNKTSLMSMLIIWITICVAAYFINTEIHFYIMAAFVGLVMGGIQSQARSTFSKLIPSKSKDTASYFSFYDSTEKLAIVLGMFSFGLLEHFTGSMRSSALLLSVFFILSFVLIAMAKLKPVEK